MTVSTTSTKISYVGDGSQVLFPVPFSYPDASTIHAMLNGVETTNFSVSSAGLLFTTAPAATVVILIYRSIPLTQPADYINNPSFDTQNLETSLDRLTEIAQQNNEQDSRALKFAPSTLFTPPDMDVPALNTFPLWDGDKVAWSSLSSSLPTAGTTTISGSYTAVRALDSTVTNYTMVQGRSSTGDGGQGWFRADASDTTSADNDGTILVAADGMRWKRLFTGAVDTAWFGANGGGDVTAELQAAVTLALTVTGGELVYSAPDYSISASLKIPAGSYGWTMRGLGVLWPTITRSEERRVGKECRSRWSPYH